jgi:hypothetical protein
MFCLKSSLNSPPTSLAWIAMDAPWLLAIIEAE